jgi:hypothetical protein
MRYLFLTPNLGLWYPKDLILSSLDIRMLIMPNAKWIEKVSLGHVNSLDGPLSLGLQRNKIVLLLCTTTLDSTNSQGLWLHYEPNPSSM